MPTQTFVLLIIIFFACNPDHQIDQKRGKEITINDTLTVSTSPIIGDDFEEDLTHWRMELEEGGKVSLIDGEMDVDVGGGATIWYQDPLIAPLMIEYEAKVIQAGGPNDRVSDLNCFWLARDPEYPNDFFKNAEKRGGIFNHYDSLRLYYVGLGGHNNTRTRFRKYDGEGNKPLLPQFDLSDPEFLIVPNKINRIRIIVFDHIVQYYRNDQLIFELDDENPYEAGYFGLRTVQNHMRVDDFAVYSLNEKK